MWTARMLLEAALHADNAFVTLTYSEASLPRNTGNGMPTLHAGHLSQWLKRLRKEIAPSRVRFYGVGEYGDETWRPHYHVILFGYPSCRFRDGRRLGAGDVGAVGGCRCEPCHRLRDTWGHGHVDNARFEVGSAQYVAGYVTKKMTSVDDARLQGRAPEFSRMSRRPGIGVGALSQIAAAFRSLDNQVAQSDVPGALRFGARLLPIGRFLRGKLRTEVGRVDELPETVRQEIFAEMLPLLMAARSSTEDGSLTLKGQLRNASVGSRASLAARHQIHNRRKL